MKNRLTLAALLLAATGLMAETKELTVSVPGGKTTLKNVVVRVPLGSVALNFKTAHVTGGPFNNDVLPAQLVSLPLTSSAVGSDLVVVVPTLEANKTTELKVTLDTSNKLVSATGKPVPTFTWKDADSTAPELAYDGKLVLAYVRPKFDPAATPPKKAATENPTIKVYHHFYDETGEVRLTNGPEGQFPHHRGIYFGFNNISYEGKKRTCGTVATANRNSTTSFSAAKAARSWVANECRSIGTVKTARRSQ